MCLAVPGKIIKIDGQKVTVDYSFDQRQALTGGTEVKVGNYVLVQMGIVVKVIPAREARLAQKAWQKSASNP